MSRFRRRTATVALATSVVLLGSTGAAFAQTLTLQDTQHDVWQTTDAGQTFSKAPRSARGDVTKVTANYGGKNLVITQHFARLDRINYGDVYTIALRTNAHLRRLVFVQAQNVDWAGHAWMDNAQKKPVTCTVGEKIDYKQNTVQVSVPATCLKSPRWVQLTTFDLHVVSKDLMYGDNPMNKQALPKGWSSRLHRG